MKRRNIPQGIEKQPSFSLLDDNEKDKSFKYHQPPPSPVTYSSNKVLEQDYFF
jgi:dolichyl-phosphate-mannose-protein mannosyltransferase